MLWHILHQRYGLPLLPQHLSIPAPMRMWDWLRKFFHRDSEGVLLEAVLDIESRSHAWSGWGTWGCPAMLAQIAQGEQSSNRGQQRGWGQRCCMTLLPEEGAKDVGLGLNCPDVKAGLRIWECPSCRCSRHDDGFFPCGGRALAGGMQAAYFA